VIAPRLLLLTCASACACELSTAPRFGASCNDDGDCARELACNAAGHCVPPPPLPTEGRSCAEPATLVDSDGGALFDATRILPFIVDDTSTGASACDTGRVITAAFDVPATVGAGAVLTISVAAPFPVSVALADASCVETIDYACAARATNPALVVPLVPAGSYRVLVVADADARGDVTLRVQQHECPPGFVPDDDGCFGFSPIAGTTPRIAHSLDATSDGRAVAVGGIGEGGAALGTVDVYNAATHAFSRSALEFARTGHATAFLPDGRLLLFGGVANENAEDAPDTLQFVPGAVAFTELETNEVIAGLQFLGCRAAGLSVVRAPLAVVTCETGDAFVLDITGPPQFPDTCDSNINCADGQACVVPTQDPIGVRDGVCVCFDGEACASVEEQFVWLERASPVGAAAFGGSLVRVDGGVGDAVVLLVGGNRPDGISPSVPLLFFARENAWFHLHPTLADAIAPRVDAAAFAVDGRVIVIGGATNDGRVTPLIERFDPLADAAPTTAQLRRARTNSAAALLPDGRVLVIGGRGEDGALLSSSELVDVDALTIRGGPVLPLPLAEARAATLANGEVLVLGGVTDGGLAQHAYLLSHRPPSLVAEELGPDAAPGARCDDPVVLTGSGVFVSSTFGHDDDEHRTRDDASCDGGVNTAGLDAFLRYDLPANSSLALRLTSPHLVDLTLDVVASCGSNVCLASADDGDFADEELVVAATGVDRELTIVIDSYNVGLQYEYSLTYEVSP
jgi:hypothetical protein